MPSSSASMSVNGSLAEAEQQSDELDELYEGRFSSRDYYPSSSSATAVFPTHVVLKRQTFPHWEEGVLKDEVVVQLQERSGEMSSEKSELEYNIPEAASTFGFPATSSAAGTSTDGEPNTSPMRAQTQLNGLSPDHPSPFLSFSPPHLPPATQFPPLDSRTRFLRSGSDGKEQVPTFSFQKLQMLAEASSSPRRSTIHSLPGLHNQVQGSLSSPTLWREISGDFGIKAHTKLGGDAESVASSSTSSLTSIDAPAIDAWPSMKDEQHVGLQSTQLAFVDSFAPGRSDVGDTTAQKYPATGSGSQEVDSACTCGHAKHYVRNLSGSSNEGVASDGDATSLSGLNHGERTDSSVMSRRRSGSADTLPAVENLSNSNSSIRANASTNSLDATTGSRTSSEYYLSANFPDSDGTDYYFARRSPVSTIVSEEDGMRDENHDGHRVYFPVQPSRKPSFGNSIRNFFLAARRRVSSMGGLATNQVPYMHLASLPPCAEPETGKQLTEQGAVRGPSSERRGRSLTIRPLDLLGSTSNPETPLVVEEFRNSEDEREVEKQGKGTRSSGKFNFIRRFSQRFGRSSNTDEPSAMESSVASLPYSTVTISSMDTDVQPPASLSDQAMAKEPQPERRESSGAYFFRRFSLASPRTPRSGGQGFSFRRG